MQKKKNEHTSIYDKKGEVVSEDSYNALNSHLVALIAEILKKSKP